MLTFKYAELKNPTVGLALGKLREAEGVSTKTAYAIIKILRWMTKEEKIAQELIKGIYKELCEKNEDGSPKEPDGPGSWKIAEANVEVFGQKMEDWAKLESSFDWVPLSAKELASMKKPLTPGELFAIEWMVDLEDLNS